MREQGEGAGVVSGGGPRGHIIRPYHFWISVTNYEVPLYITHVLSSSLHDTGIHSTDFLMTQL
jgi:hypothetical protein